MRGLRANSVFIDRPLYACWSAVALHFLVLSIAYKEDLRKRSSTFLVPGQGAVVLGAALMNPIILPATLELTRSVCVSPNAPPPDVRMVRDKLYLERDLRRMRSELNP